MHLDILHLLGVRHGIVVLTKIDLVDAKRRRAVREEIDILLADTTLDGSPVYEVSSLTGEGIDALRSAIQQHVQHSTRPEPGGCFRLPIDRAFVMRGHGLVVTGTATAGTITTDATVRLLPTGIEARVRAIQVHGQLVPAGHYGQRLALNLAGVEHDAVQRGHVVCEPELDRVTDRFDARVELRPAVRRPLPSHAEVRLYLGTAEALAKIVWLDGRPALAPKQATYAQLVLREPIAAFGGDRFIVRDQTARSTIGGGVVLHPFARRPLRGRDPRITLLASIDHAETPAARLNAHLALAGSFAMSPEYLAATANLRSAAVRSLLADQPGVIPLPDSDHVEVYASADKWEQLGVAVDAALTAYHTTNPREAGMDMESLRSQLAPDLPPKVFRVVIAQLERQRALVRQDSLVRLPTHLVALDLNDTPVAAELVAALERHRFMPPDIALLASQLGSGARIAKDRFRDIVKQLEREGRIIRVSPDLYFAASAIVAARELVRQHAAQHGQIDAASLRDLIGGSRKFSIALLNYFDRTGFTLRVGDVRKLRKS